MRRPATGSGTVTIRISSSTPTIRWTGTRGGRKPSDPALIPTQLTLEGHPDLAVTYPESHVFKAPFAPQGIAVYEDRITLRARLPQGAAGLPPTARLRVQACNDQSCLAPATLAVPVGGRPQ